MNPDTNAIHAGLNIAGASIMVLSLAIVASLLIYCMYRLLKN